MLESIFVSLNSWLQGNYWIALISSFLWGILSIIASPCHLSTIPIVIGLISKSEQRRYSGFKISLAFSLGLGIITTIFCMLTVTFGFYYVLLPDWINFLIPVVLIYIVLVFWDLVPLPRLNVPNKTFKSKSNIPGIAFMGLIIGITLGPCTLAFFAPIISLIAKDVISLKSIGYISAFLLGHIILIFLVGISYNRAMNSRHINKLGHKSRIIRKICGTIILFVVIYFIIKLF